MSNNRARSRRGTQPGENPRASTGAKSHYRSISPKGPSFPAEAEKAIHLTVPYDLAITSTRLIAANIRSKQYWLPGSSASLSAMTETMGSLPDTNTTRSTMGADYSVTPNLRFNAAYQGNYATAEHSHTWNMGLTYRFAIP